MEATLEAFRIFFRWAHVLFGILWIGNSFFFNWMINNFEKPDKPKEGVEGELWMLHGGGFFQVEKKTLDPRWIPKVLHWFKYESYFTWLTGFILLTLVYYLSGGMYLIKDGSSLLPYQASLIGLSSLIIGWLVYDLLWRSPLAEDEALCSLVTFLFLCLEAYVLCQLFVGRGAYIHMGAIIGTMMAANVFIHIIPNQKIMLREVEAGIPHDPQLAIRAKHRSRHNNYFTFPVIFIMLSSHFPGTYGVENNWLILITVFIAGALIKHFLNIKKEFKFWLPASLATLTGAIVFILTIVAPPAPETTSWVIIKDWSQVLGRFAHVMVAILWIGNSMFFTWLTLSFRPQKIPEDGVDGEVWMLHGGGFFHVKKRPLESRFVPKTLHWFKWESYVTWLTGMFLMIVVYYSSDALLLIAPDSAVSSIFVIHLGVVSLALGWILYDLLWRTKIRHTPELGIALSLVALSAFSLVYLHYFSTRGAYIHIGALLGTIMAANVFFHIIPGQKKMMAAVERGEVPDPSWSKHAKTRSMHNHYMTFAVLFFMLSSHFPTIHGHPLTAIWIIVILIVTVLIKYILNFELPWIELFQVSFIAPIVGLFASIHFLIKDDSDRQGLIPGLSSGDKAVLGFLTCVGFLIIVGGSGVLKSDDHFHTQTQTLIVNQAVSSSRAFEIIQARCTSCHSRQPMDTSIPAPAGVYFDTPQDMQKFALRIYARSVASKAMPLANKTGMLDEERELIGRWVNEGAKLDSEK